MKSNKITPSNNTQETKKNPKLIYNLPEQIGSYKIEDIQYFYSPKRTQIQFDHVDQTSSLLLIVYHNAHKKSIEVFKDQLINTILSHTEQTYNDFLIHKSALLETTNQDSEKMNLYATHFTIDNGNDNLFLFMAQIDKHILVFNIQSNEHKKTFKRLFVSTVSPIISKISFKKEDNVERE